MFRLVGFKDSVRGGVVINRLAHLEGIYEVTPLPAVSRVEVDYNPQLLDKEDIAKVILQAGYKAFPVL